MQKTIITVAIILIINTSGLKMQIGAEQPLVHSSTEQLEMEAFIDGFIAGKMLSNNIAGVVISVVKDGRIYCTKGYGYADVSQRLPVDSGRTLFRIGSISKLFTWTAVMQLVEQGKLDLYADVNSYLDFKIPHDYPNPITLNHLMSHTSGFEERTFGIQPGTPDQLTPLGRWLKTHIPARVRPPGEFSAYSNYGASLAGYIVERVSGIPFDEYIERNIFIPLGMANSSSRQPPPNHLLKNLSQGYRFFNSEYHPQPFETFNVAPAASFSASAMDIAKFMIAHLNNGGYGEATILQPAAAKLMHTRNFSHDPRLSGWAHGFIEMNMNEQHVIGHAGEISFFHSRLMLFPDHNMGIFIATNTEGGDAITKSFQRVFLNRYFPLSTKSSPTLPPYHMGNLNRFNGSYHTTLISYTTPEKLKALNSFNIESDKYELVVNKQRYIAIAPLVFQQIHSDKMLIFREDDQGNITHAFLGEYPEIALEKNRWFENPAFSIGLLSICVMLLLNFLITTFIRVFIKRKRDSHSRFTFYGSVARLIAVLEAILIFILLLTLIFAVSDYSGISSGEMPLWRFVIVNSLAIALLTPGLILFTFIVWIKGLWKLLSRIHYTLITIASVALVWLMYFWNIFGKDF